MPAGNTVFDPSTGRVTEAEVTFRHGRSSRVVSGSEAPIHPEFSMQPLEGSEFPDDLAAARGIMVSVLLGLALWGSIIAFCFA